MPERSEIFNANDLTSHFALLAEAQRAHAERPLATARETEVPPSSVGVSPRTLLEELRFNEPQAAQDFLQRAANHVPPPPTAPAAAVQPAPPAVPTVLPTVEAATPAQDTELEKHLIFSLGAMRYAVPLDHIIEIAELENSTPVPNLPEWVMGITNLRGDILSLIDLNVLIGEATDEVPRGSNLLVTQTNAGDLTTCLVVDRVYGVLHVNPHQIQKLDKVANTVISTHTRGYFSEGQDFLSLLDLEGLLRALELPH